MTIGIHKTGESTARNIEDMINWLASFGESGEGGVTRLLYSKPWLSAQQSLKEKMEDWGIEPYFDDAGNLFGRIEGTENRTKAILTGSHIDTVINGGKFDGAYGILASLLSAKHLLDTYGRPKTSIEVVSLCEEEGSRFPLTFWGSGNLTGLFDCQKTPAVHDRDGVSIEQAMKDCGFGKRRYRRPFRRDVKCFIELHIEQGSILEESGRQIGIVTDIVGQRRFTVMVKGESNHAGTTPMNARKDAVAVSALCISYLTNKAKAAPASRRRTLCKRLFIRNPFQSALLADVLSFPSIHADKISPLRVGGEVPYLLFKPFPLTNSFIYARGGFLRLPVIWSVHLSDRLPSVRF